MSYERHGCHTLTRHGTRRPGVNPPPLSTIHEIVFLSGIKGARYPTCFTLMGSVTQPHPAAVLLLWVTHPPSFELIRSTNKTVSTPSKFPETPLFLRWTLIKISKSLRARVANFLITSSKLSFHSLRSVFSPLNYRIKQNILVKPLFLGVSPLLSTCCLLTIQPFWLSQWFK